MAGAASLRGFFGFVDAFGPGTFTRLRVEQALGGGPGARDVIRALTRLGIFEKRGYARHLECHYDRRDCRGFSVGELMESPRPRLMAVCSAQRRSCGEHELSDESLLAELTLSLPALALALRPIFDVDGPSSLDDPAGVLGMGEQDLEGTHPRNVYLLASPDYQALPAYFRELGRERRRALVLIPKRTAVFAELRRTTYGPGTHVELDFLEDLVVLRDGALALGDRERAPAAALEAPNDARNQGAGEAVPLTGAARVVLALDCRRSRAGMTITVNGRDVTLPDRAFALLLQLVDRRLRAPNAWASYRELGVEREQSPCWRLNRCFDSVVPPDFEVALLDRRKQCCLNPDVAVAHVEWASVMAHPSHIVKAIAERHRGP